MNLSGQAAASSSCSQRNGKSEPRRLLSERPTMWNPLQHSDDENLRWSWLRAVEWASWPAFLSQAIAPFALIFVSWPLVLGAVIVANVLWAASVRYRFVGVDAAFVGVFVTQLKWLICPAVAVYLWANGRTINALSVLFWPLVAGIVAAISPANVGIVQKQFMAKLGYSPSTVG